MPLSLWLLVRCAADLSLFNKKAKRRLINLVISYGRLGANIEKWYVNIASFLCVVRNESFRFINAIYRFNRKTMVNWRCVTVDAIYLYYDQRNGNTVYSDYMQCAVYALISISNKISISTAFLLKVSEPLPLTVKSKDSTSSYFICCLQCKPIHWSIAIWIP